MGSRSGAGLLLGASLIGLIVSLLDYFQRGGPIAHTGGALLVTVSTAVLALLSLLLIWATPRPSAWRRVLEVCAMIDVVGTGVAAWFLHAWWLLACTMIGAIGFTLTTFTGAPRARGARA